MARLEAMLAQRYGEGAFSIGSNGPELLGKLSPTGAVRSGAFEVFDVATSDLLYSKLEKRRHLCGSRKRNEAGEIVHDDTTFDDWCDTVLDRR